ncbi:molybdenum ABC transporter permease [Bordetella ansorpii]|uniref:Molybdenum transport system permease n=2 Tax=Bordetella ansorpii TaxID=288768 RepID=A0A157MTZ7_9BORD|nr:molybdenum ABC transporter permease [Bordetella ansorpii]
MWLIHRSGVLGSLLKRQRGRIAVANLYNPVFRCILVDMTLPTLAAFEWFPLILSLKVAALATVVALVIGVALGWLFARRPFPGSGVLEAICMLPLVLPPTVIGYAILVAAGRRSPLGAWLREHLDYTIIFSWHGAVVASAVVALPLVLKSASSAFAHIDRTLEAAASTLRQSPWSVFVRVTLPLAWPGILAGTLLAFARAMGEFGASLMVAGSIPGRTQTLSMAIYDAVQAGQDDLALLLVTVTSLLSVAILVASNRYLSVR